jgi:hypothetical protein
VRPESPHAPGLRRPTLLATFALVSLVPLALLGYGLSSYLKHQIRGRAYADARQSAALVAAALQTQLTPYQFRHGLGQSDLLALDRTVDGLKSRGVADVSLSDRHGNVLYAQDRATIGHALAASREQQAAARGKLVAGRTKLDPSALGGQAQGWAYAVWVPLRFGGQGAVRGVLQLDLPEQPISAAVASDVRTAYWLIGGGLLLLWISLFRVVAGASRKLRRQAEENARLALHDQLTGLPSTTRSARARERATSSPSS